MSLSRSLVLSLFALCCLVLDLSTDFTLAPHPLVLADAAAATFNKRAPHLLVLADPNAAAVFAFNDWLLRL